MNDPGEDVRKMTEKFLRKELYVIYSKPEAPRDEIDEMLGEHLAHQVRIEKEGILFAAGPQFDEGADAPRVGMIVVRADSFDHAREIAESDPFHKAGLRSFSVHKWIVNEGGFTVTVNYSDQTAKIV